MFNPRTHRDFGWAWLSKLLILLAYAGIATYLTLFLGEVYGMDIGEQLAFNALAQIIGVATVVLFSIAGGFLSDRLAKRKPFVFWGSIIMSFGIAFVAVSPLFGQSGLTIILLGSAVVGAGAGLFFAVDQALCIALLPNPEDTAKDLGVLNIANSLPSSLSPFLAGVVVIPVGTALFGAGGGYMLWFAVAALVGVVGAVLVTRIRGID
ncbi:MFS transporter [Microbacterium pumilum]|uniref:Major facilitator superfamily (MFS) profile domain-containing protein n=1 Tax=Microbacterium pumilum TaxID=344165 RepID=A0ABP5EEG3_9MICO